MIDIFIYDGTTIKKGKLKDLPGFKTNRHWIDLINPTKEEVDKLAEAYELHPLTAEDLLNVNTRVKIEDFPNYLVCVFYGITKNAGVELVEVDCVIGENFVISNHKDVLPSFEELKSVPDKLDHVMKKGTDFLFHRLLDHEIDNFFPVLQSIDDEIEPIENEALSNPRPELMRKILNLKRSLSQVKKITVPQREKIGNLAKEEHRFISKKAMPYFHDVYDHAIRIADTLDANREAVANTFEMYMSAVSNNTNDVMKMLSMIATIALPLTVISGIYGTNFQELPGQEFPHSFWIMVSIMFLLSITMLYYFKKKGWIFSGRRA
ncbi:magnesium/cobalt transporter CorA [Candidatus Woesearchaeota archaeon]|nr:magnesium/cobalt transporter CorA [Candidatus Woesearchaeota archaeon]